MNIKHLLPLQRIIGKIDNDFNIDQSDWIPRVAAWTIDAMSILKCTPYVRKRFKCDVNNRIVNCTYNLYDTKDIKVYDNKGCSISNLKDKSINMTPYGAIRSSVESINSSTGTKWSDEEIAIFTGDKEIQNRLKIGRVCQNNSHNFVVIDNNKLEINFDADWVVVEALTIATYYDDYFNEDVPYIYDNGLLLDAICWYIMMKILQRGYKHPVFSLSGNEPVNPYVQWNKIKDQAAASVRKDIRDSSKNEGWNNLFYNATFLPRG